MHILNRIKQSFISLVTDDSSTYPQAISDYKGKSVKSVRHSVYGVCSNPPKNSLGILFQVEGMRAVQYGIFDFSQGRFKNLKPGEVQIGNYLTKASIKFDKDGNVTVNVPSGDLTANVSGSVDITSDDITFNHTSGYTINGNMTVNGTITATNLNSTGAGVDFNSHIHTGDSGGNTGPPK